MVDSEGHKVCLIDDDPINNLLCEVMLRKSGYANEINVFLSGEEALGWLEMQPASAWPDVIFLDINMPGLDGWDVLKRLETLARPVRVKMLTSSVSDADRKKALGYPLVDDYLLKPLKREYLMGQG